MHHQLPAGKYYIGDPCYIFSESWDDLLGVVSFDGDIEEYKTYQLWGHSTAFGDGMYDDQNDNEYCVDSGVLAAVPYELIEDAAGETNGTIIDAPNGLLVEYNNGTFIFNDITIMTDTDDTWDSGYDDDGAEDVYYEND